MPDKNESSLSTLKLASANYQPATEHEPPRSSSERESVDLTEIVPVPWTWVNERVYAAIRGCSVKTLQKERRLNIGCPFRRIGGTSIRYRFGDIIAFLDSQPGGGGGKAIQRSVRTPGRPSSLTVPKHRASIVSGARRVS